MGWSDLKMRKEGMIAGGAIALIGLFLMFVQVFQGYQTPIGNIGVSSNPYAQTGLVVLIIGIIILAVSAVMRSSR